MIVSFRIVCSLLVCALLVPLNACASSSDPEKTRESLSEVAEDSAPSEADEEFDASLHPEPVVEPVECSHYLTITVRGTGEPHTGQLLSPVVRLISDARPDEVTHVDLDYAADVNVREGSTRGVRMLVDTLNVQHEQCPGQRFVLLGYSQGALVIGDALAASDYRMVGSRAGGLTEAASDGVLAVVLYGDPRFFGGEPYNSGDFDVTRNGLMPRPEGTLKVFADRIRNYCVSDDFICQADLLGFGEPIEQEGHTAYFSNGMQNDGAAFVITRLEPPVKRRRNTDSDERRLFDDSSDDSSEDSSDREPEGEEEG